MKKTITAVSVFLFLAIISLSYVNAQINADVRNSIELKKNYVQPHQLEDSQIQPADGVIQGTSPDLQASYDSTEELQPAGRVQ